MRWILDRLLKLFSSLGLSVVLLILLGLLTWLGTIEQVHSGLFEVQKKYFESAFLIHQAGRIPIPLPGAGLVQGLLFINILVGGIVRIRKGVTTMGVLVTHVGIMILLLSGFVKLYFSQDGHITLYEDDSANYFQSYYRWEIAITEELGGGRYKEYIIPQEDFVDAVDGKLVTLFADDLPFDLEVGRFMKNCRPRPKGPMFEVDVPVIDGAYLHKLPLVPTAEQNLAGIYADAITKEGGARQKGILWGVDSHPWSVDVGGKTWAIDLRHERYSMPFALTLDRFTKEDHPRINMPRVFASDVTVAEGESERQVKIEMNEPLRDRGLVFFQASWGPSNARPGDPLFSTLSVVRNPSDQWPLIACIVIAIGLILHFARKLLSYIRVEVRKA